MCLVFNMRTHSVLVLTKCLVTIWKEINFLLFRIWRVSIINGVPVKPCEPRSIPYVSEPHFSVWHYNLRDVKDICALINSKQYLIILISFFAVRQDNNGCGRDPFNQNSDRSDRQKWSTSKGGPVSSKRFRLRPNRSIEFWTEISGTFGWMDHTQCLFILSFISIVISFFPLFILIYTFDFIWALLQYCQ